jgi:hypothetical protein
MRTGELRADLPLGLLRDLIFGGIDHLISGFLFNQRDLDIDSAADQIVNLIFNGIATPPVAEAPTAEVLAASKPSPHAWRPPPARTKSSSRRTHVSRRMNLQGNTDSQQQVVTS